jgi:DNA-binding MarR family transcriptional regulator
MGWIQGAVLARLVRLLSQAGFPEVRLPHANLLTSIPPDTGARMSELAQRLRITRGAVTQLVATLEEAGLLERSPHPTDRRSVIVRPTPRALEGYRIARGWTIDLYDSWRDLAGEDRWQVFTDVLAEIAAHEQRLDGEP